MRYCSRVVPGYEGPKDRREGRVSGVFFFFPRAAAAGGARIRNNL